MRSRLRRWFSDPLVLLCIASGLLAFVVQSGELGTADTMHRLQTTHWLWTSEPQVFPNEYPEFGLHGRGGQLYSWYGIGQSLLMLPADLIGTWIAHWKIFAGYGDDPAVRSIVVSYSTNILVNVLTALVAFRLLRQLQFRIRESVLGVLALLFCTTHLHYAQNMMENNYIMLLTLTGFSFQYEWLRVGSRRALFWGSAALGLNLLTRLTTGVDLIAGGVFILCVLWFEGVRGRDLRKRLLDYCKIAAPVYALFLLADRLYQFYRFGSFTNTYVSLFAKEQRVADPTLPANFPWSTPFYEGVLGPLFKPEKSIFLFDPLLVLGVVLLIFLWRRLSPEVRAYGVTSLLLLAGYISFYARYTYWAGDFAWGDRYVSTSVELVALLAVPLLLRMRGLTDSKPQGLKPESLEVFDGAAESRALSKPGALSNQRDLSKQCALSKRQDSDRGEGFTTAERKLSPVVGRWIWRVGIALVAVSLIIQVASLAFWLPLEIYQMETLGHPTFVIALRFRNIAAFALGKMQDWGLNNESMMQDPWDYVHITTWNFLPFLLRRVGAAPEWVVETAFVVYGAGIAGLLLICERLRRLWERRVEW